MIKALFAIVLGFQAVQAEQDFKHIYKANDSITYNWSADASELGGGMVTGKLTEKVAKVEGEKVSLEWSISDIENAPIELKTSLAGTCEKGLPDALEAGQDFEIFKIYTLANLLPEKALADGKPLEVNLKNDHLETKGKFTSMSADPKTQDVTVEGAFDISTESFSNNYTVKSVFNATTHRLTKSEVVFDTNRGKITVKIEASK
ncbi:MAG: hypothetical protein JSS72_10115 [Armatimonadetes bacterium]|nr:hypothetical protein [Armatimonadota bacterium]